MALDWLNQYEFLGGDSFVSNITTSGYQAATTLAKITIDKVELRLNGEVKAEFPCSGKRYAQNKIILNANITTDTTSFFFDEVRLIASAADGLVFSSIKLDTGAIIDYVSPNKTAVVLNFNLSYQTIAKDFVYINESSANNMTQVQEHSLASNAHESMFAQKFDTVSVIDSYQSNSVTMAASANAAKELDGIISGLISGVKDNQFSNGTISYEGINTEYKINKFKSGLKQMEVTYLNVNPTATVGSIIFNASGGHIVNFKLPESFEKIITSVRLFGENVNPINPNKSMYGEFDEWVWVWALHYGDLLDSVPLYFRRWTGGVNEKINLKIVVEGY